MGSALGFYSEEVVFVSPPTPTVLSLSCSVGYSEKNLCTGTEGGRGRLVTTPKERRAEPWARE